MWGGTSANRYLAGVSPFPLRLEDALEHSVVPPLARDLQVGPGCAVGFEAILFQDTFGRGVMHQGCRLQPVQAQFVPGDAHSGADDTCRQRAAWALQSVLYPTWAFWKAPRTIELSVNRPTMISSPASSHRPFPGRAGRCRPQRRVRPPAVVRGWRAGSPAARVA